MSRHEVTVITALAFVLSGLAGTSFAQQTPPPPHEGKAYQGVTYSLQDDQEEQADQPPPLPELPETIVRGRPDPFPARPLEGDTVVTPTRSEVPISEIGSSVSVITEDRIQASGRANVAEVLRDVAGVTVMRQGGPGGLQSVFIRGANSQHTKVLLDGIPINDPSNATRGFDFSTLDVENIERIEVLRGPQSILYGSDAIGGVINIITKRGEGPLSLRATSRGGTFGTMRQTLQLSGGNDQAYYSFGGAFSDTDGISQAARRFDNTERDGYSNGTLSGRFGWTPADQLNIDYVFRWADVDAEIDSYDFGLGRPIDDPIRHNLSRSFYNRIQAQSLLLDGAVEQTIGFSLTDYRRDDTHPEQFVPPEFAGQTRRVDWQANLLLLENNTLSVGAGYLEEDASQTGMSAVSQNEAGVFILDTFSVSELWFVTAGARWDEWNTAGPASTYRVTNLIRIGNTGAAVHGSIGTGFRAPALAESLFEFGNPDLRPERSKGWDAGLTQTLADGRLVVDATYFRNDLTDLIIFDFDTFRLENVGNARTTGVELSVLWLAPAGMTVRGEYTYTDAANLDTKTQLPRRPYNKASLQVGRGYLSDRARVDLELLYVGRRIDTPDDYFLLNLVSTCRLSDHWVLFVRGDNLLDEKYEEIYGYGAPGIAFYGGLDLLW